MRASVNGCAEVGAQHPLHSGSADLDAGAKHLPRYGTRAQLRFRTKPPMFVDGPANRIVDAVPDHGSVQQARPGFAFSSPDPGTDSVAMQHEVLGGFLDAPSSQSPELQG